ncbi:putative siderophore-dependent iron transporter [Corynespora cassiicola Philippines]|uniref:Putative siderophore-dependent iron transporter n=1 Tax=Corynespora cassiicola Philippines TaxID=1448308 RepID=A0A2T2N2U6_CORCC|nr:putative siderophore-dependent iron transporter [Corynespora cassiicola Philippines]
MQNQQAQTAAAAALPNPDVITRADPEDAVELEKKDQAPNPDAQIGVQKIEAVTLSWTKAGVAALLFNIWIIFLTNGFRISILISLSPYVTSDFQSHSLLNTINIVSDAMTAAVYIPMAKLLDTWGRAEGFALMVGFSSLGVILMATSQNLATFCAAQVFYSIGFAGVIYTVAVLAADVTSLRNRGIAFAFTSSPYMITAFAGSKAAEAFLLHVNWRWGFGSFAIIVPVVSFPLFILLRVNIRKAQKFAIFEKPAKEGTLMQRVWKNFIAFDLPGVVLFAGGLVVFLLPFTLARSAPNGWNTDYIIAMIVVGFLILVAFGFYETYLAPAPFLKNKFLMDRTVIGACLIDMTYQISYYCWNSYFTSFLQVVCNLGIAEAGYVNSTFQVVSGVLLFIVGYLIRRTGRFKWLFYVTVPIYTFGLGLMIYFRRPNQSIGYIIMCEIFISIGGSVFILLVQLAVLAAVDHQHIAAVLALLYVSGSIGGAIGSTISGTIWTNTFLKELMRNLPESAQADALTIYASLPAQLAYPVGSPERLAIQEAYGYGQARMLAAGVGIFGLSFIWMFLIRNHDVSKKTGQTKGIVF